MSFATTSEMAEKWSISRRITRLCGEGRIEGDALKGNTWLVSDSTEKPDDPQRVRKNMQNTFYNIVYSMHISGYICEYPVGTYNYEDKAKAKEWYRESSAGTLSSRMNVSNW